MKTKSLKDEGTAPSSQAQAKLGLIPAGSNTLPAYALESNTSLPGHLLVPDPLGSAGKPDPATVPGSSESTGGNACCRCAWLEGRVECSRQLGSGDLSQPGCVWGLLEGRFAPSEKRGWASLMVLVSGNDGNLGDGVRVLEGLT